MKLQNAIKKVAALSTGAAMLGASVLGAVAYDLSNYPEPFVKNGQFNGVLVVGENAKPSDVIGVTDIAMSLQASAVVEETVSVPGQETGAGVSEGAKVEQGTDKLNLMETFSSVKSFFGADDLDVLKKVTWQDNDGNDYNVEFRVQPGSNVRVQYSSDLNDGQSPVLAIDWKDVTNVGTAPAYDLIVDFQDPVNFTAMAGESVELFGQTFTVAEASQLTDASKLTLYKAAVDETFEPGTEKTVVVGGHDVTVEVVNANSNNGEAIIRVNGEQASVKKGESRTVGGEKIYVKDVFIGNVLSDYAAVRLLIGADKVVLENGQSVRTGDNEDAMSGTSVNIQSSGGKATRITVTITPNDLAQEYAVDGTKLGEEFVDPVFGAVKWVFADAVPGLESDSRDVVKLYPSSSDRLNLKFENRRGDMYDVVLLRENSGNAEFRYGSGTNDVYVLKDNADTGAAGDGTNDARRVVKDNRFIVQNGEYTRILELTYVDQTNHEITLKDVATGATQTWKAVSPINDSEGTGGTGFNGEATDTDYDGDGNYEADSSTWKGTFTYDGKDYDFYIDGQADAIAIDSGTAKTSAENYATLVSKGGEELWLNPISGTWASATTNNVLALIEETTYNNDDPEFHGIVSFNVTYDTNKNKKIYVSDAGFITTVPSFVTASPAPTIVGSWSGLQSEDGSDKQYFVTQYGTYVAADLTGDGGYAEVYYPTQSMNLNVFLAPVSAGTTTTGGEGSVVTEKVQKINVGAAKLDSEVQDLVGQENMIVVGGPCANSVAAELMGNPTECAAGFEEGKAMIKSFDHDSGAVSILVAGYSAQDTRLASQVLANYEDYRDQLKGSEVIVEGTSINNVVISAPAQE